MPELYHYNPIWITTRPIAHRGLHGPGVPEDSQAAFGAAAAAGYAIELDIRMTADNQLIVNHDPTTGRLSGTNTSIKTTSAAELASLRLSGTAQSIPLLDDVLKLINGRVPLAIEIKHSIPPRAIGPLLMELLNTYPGEVSVASFDPRIVAWFRLHAPHIPRGQIASSLPEKSQPRWIRHIFRAMPLNFWSRPQFIAFDIRDYPNRALSFWQRRLHAPVVLWTVENDEQLATARQAGCNVVFEHIRP